MKTQKERVTVTKRALIQRINRVLVKEDQTMKASRGMQAFTDLGDLYIVDINRNVVCQKDVDLEAKAREIGVLKPYEALATE